MQNDDQTKFFNKLEKVYTKLRKVKGQT